MKKNTKYRYPTTKRETIEGQRHYNINDGQWKLPSVTTILDKTQSAREARRVEEVARSEGGRGCNADRGYVCGTWNGDAQDSGAIYY